MTVSEEGPNGWILESRVTDRFPGWVTALATIGILAVLFVLARWRFDGSATAEIHGPDKADAGVPVIFDGSSSTGQGFEWQPPAGTKSTTLDDGRRIVIVAPPGRHSLTLTVRSAAWGRLTADSVATAFTVGGQPGPAPGPGPDPGPLPPDDPHGMAAWAQREAMALVESPNRAAEAKDIAAVLRAVAAEIAAGTLATPVDAGTRADALIDERLGAAAPGWEKFRWAFLAKSKAVFGMFPKLDSVAACFLGTAAGLEAVH